MDILANEKGFGQHVYDEFGKESVPGVFGISRDVAVHLFMKHMPEQQLKGAFDLLRGEGDQTIATLRTLGPVVGMTASEGAPGGQARGEAFDIKNRYNMRLGLAWPSIRKMIERGEVDQAREALTRLGASPREQEARIRNALNPAGTLRGRTLQDINRQGTPELRGRFERAQQRDQRSRSGPPVPPEMPQLEMPQ
jgi:hypothetical protein